MLSWSWLGWGLGDRAQRAALWEGSSFRVGPSSFSSCSFFAARWPWGKPPPLCEPNSETGQNLPQLLHPKEGVQFTIPADLSTRLGGDHHQGHFTDKDCGAQLGKAFDMTHTDRVWARQVSPGLFFVLLAWPLWEFLSLESPDAFPTTTACS
jgi:hypothetical protein